MWGGFQGEGTKTVLPKEAHAKITCRLVGDQDPQATIDRIERHLRAHLQPGTTLSVKATEKARAFSIDPSDPMLQKRQTPTPPYTGPAPCSPKTAARFRSSKRCRACCPPRPS
ncbi:hypothetical protein HMSSN036_88160 [Paenibacillus macerans]|nr:hypothetical protein HMSSN036_88160 [Paenibacillus macerans]